MELEARNIRAPELYGDYWLNSEPIFMRDLRGRVVLIDFWDYTCVNCVRTLPYVKDWQKKYDEYGLIVIGVHTPEFKFGKDVQTIQRALERAGIRYPVILDNEALLWSAFANRHWPTKYLIDKDGYIRYAQHGEGGYQQFERALQQLIVQSGFRGKLPELTDPLRETDVPGSVCYRPTGEIYLGYLRGTLGNRDGYNPESTLDYQDPGIYMPERFYATGKWLSQKEFFRFNGNEGDSGTVIVQYDATEVNAVMNAEAGITTEVRVEQDGRPLMKEIAGDDIIKGNDGASLVLVDSPRMYHLVRNKEFGSHKLTLATSSNNLEIFTFSFVTSVIPDLIQSN